MLHTLQQQQEQINAFMKTTTGDLKQMESQIDNQVREATSKMEQHKSSANQNIVTPKLIQQVTEAIDVKVKKEPATINNDTLNARLTVQNEAGPQFPALQPAPAVRQPSPQTHRELTFIEKKVLKNNKLSDLWLQISKLAFEQNYQRAYELALTHADDIYLLRLIVQTGPVVSRGLTSEVSKKVIYRMNKIVRGGIFFKMQIDWLDDFRKMGHFKSLSHQEQNEYMDTLYHFAHPDSDLVKQELKERSSEVYQSIKSHARQY